MALYLNFAVLSLTFLLLVEFKSYETAECGNNPTTCNSTFQFYRTFDGTCNNLKKYGMGSSNKPYGRICKANYGNGTALPNPRALSQGTNRLNFTHGSKLSRINSGFLQFVTHDMSMTKLARVKCCTDDLKNLASVPSGCVNIQIPSNDPFYSQYNATCMALVRTATTSTDGCTASTPLSYPEPITTRTPWLDLDVTYGITKAESDSLRIWKGGRLKTEKIDNYEYMPTGNTGCSIPPNNNEYCFKAGDERDNQNPDLTFKHTASVRFHNWICDGLAANNLYWSDEKMYQEARKINIAVHQSLTFEYVLPVIIGRENMLQENMLRPYGYYQWTSNGWSAPYNDTCEPNVPVEHATVAFRILHAILRSCMMVANENRCNIGDVRLVDVLERPHQIVGEGFNGFIYGGMTQEAKHVGPNFDSDFTSRMQLSLSTTKAGFDLYAVDLQRSREFGVASYNDLRACCGLKRAVAFDDFLDFISKENLEQIKKRYSNVNDVDAYVGALHETPAYDAVVGPTALCVMLKAFKRVQVCDRFWYDNVKGWFTPSQLQEIRKVDIASFLCVVGNDLENVQENPLLAYDPETNMKIRCPYVPKMLFYPWL